MGAAVALFVFASLVAMRYIDRRHRDSGIRAVMALTAAILGLTAVIAALRPLVPAIEGAADRELVPLVFMAAFGASVFALVAADLVCRAIEAAVRFYRRAEADYVGSR